MTIEGVSENFHIDTITNWVDCDATAPTFATLTEDDIVKMICNPQEVELSSESSDEEVIKSRITTDEAIVAATTLQEYLESNSIENVSMQDIMQVSRIKTALIENKNRKRIHQSVLTDYFH